MTLGHARHVWSLIAVMGALTVVSLLLTHLTVDVASNPALFMFLGMLFAANCFYRLWRPEPHLQAVTEAAGQILLILLFGILLSYAAVAAGLPYRDVELDLADKALGFDRSAYLGFFAHRPWLAWIIGIGYLTLLPQFAFVPLVLFSAKQHHRLQSMILAFGFALLATVAISIFTPSVTAFVHTAGALLFAWATLKVPYIRWLGLALNASLIAATPINGAHYFVDLIGGAAVAGASLAASAWICRSTQPAPEAAAIATQTV